MVFYRGARIVIGLVIICRQRFDEPLLWPVRDHASIAHCLEKLQFIRAAFQLDNNSGTSFINRQNIDPIGYNVRWTNFLPDDPEVFANLLAKGVGAGKDHRLEFPFPMISLRKRGFRQSNELLFILVDA